MTDVLEIRVISEAKSLVIILELSSLLTLLRKDQMELWLASLIGLKII